MRTRRILSVILALALIATTALLLFPRSANAGTSYYYTTDPCAGPIVINGVIYHPSCSIPAGNTTVTQQYYVPGTSTTTPIKTIQQQPVVQQPIYQQPIYQQPVYQQPVYQQPTRPSCNYNYLPPDDILSPYYGKKVNYTQPTPQLPSPSPSSSKTTAYNGNGLQSETDRLSNDIIWYGNERGWRYETKTISSADYFITRRITFSNNRAILYVDQQTAKTDYNGNFATAWWVNGTQTSESEVRWMISNYCSR